MTSPDPERPAASPARIFYGWYVVAAIGLVLMTASGLAFYNLAVLLDAFVVERGFPVALTSSATAIFFVASAVAGVAAGRLMERLDARLVMVASASLSAAALACVGLLERPWQLYLFYLVLGLCYGGCSLVPGTTIVARWFERRRPLALSLASTGLSLGGILVTPVAALLIRDLGLARAGPWLGLAFFLGIVPVTALVVRPSPDSIGREPDGARRPAHGRRAAPVRPGIAFAEAWRSRFFLAVTAGYIFALGAQVGAIAHLYRLASTRVGGEIAAVALATLAASSLVGRLAGGWLLGKVPSLAFTLAVVALQIVALLCLALAITPPLLIGAAVLFGITVGNLLMMQPLLLAEAFGTRDYGRIYSISQLVAVIGVAGGPALLGLLYETSGGYAWPYGFAAASSLLGLAILGLAGPPKAVPR